LFYSCKLILPICPPIPPSSYFIPPYPSYSHLGSTKGGKRYFRASHTPPNNNGNQHNQAKGKGRTGISENAQIPLVTTHKRSRSLPNKGSAQRAHWACLYNWITDTNSTPRSPQGYGKITARITGLSDTIKGVPSIYTTTWRTHKHPFVVGSKYHYLPHTTKQSLTTL